MAVEFTRAITGSRIAGLTSRASWRDAQVRQAKEASMFLRPEPLADNVSKPGTDPGSAAGQQAAHLGAQITRRNLNVQPTIGGAAAEFGLGTTRIGLSRSVI